MFCNKITPCGGDNLSNQLSDTEEKAEDDTPLDDIPPTDQNEGTKSSEDDKTGVKRQLSFAVSETLGDDVVLRRFMATEGILSFWKNFAYEECGRPFLRASHDANMEYVANILHREWKIKSPRIVLVVVSNVAPLHTWTNKRQLEHFQAGLIKAANTTEMWIFTQGVNIGITKVIGDAVHNELLRRQALRCHKHPNMSGPSLPPLTLVGVTREDLLTYGDMLDGRVSRVEIENEGNKLEENKFELNPDHSHFIVVRDSTINKTGINHFLMKLEHYLASSESLHCDINASTPRKHPDVCSLSTNEIPVVALLVQGGFDCARLILEHLKKHLPVVCVRGSGGLADLLAYAYYEVSERPRGIHDAEYIENSLKPALSSKIAHHFVQFRENSLARNMFRDRIMECVRYVHQNGQANLTIINLYSHTCNLEDLDEHLLCALFKSQRPDQTNWHAQMQKDLLLTLDWNSPHVAMSEVFLKDPSSKFKVDKMIFQQALTRSNREDFVDLFLKQGFQIHKYLTPKRLRFLFLKSHRQEFFRSVCWEGVLGHGLTTRIGKNFIETDLNLLIELLTGIRSFILTQDMSVNAMGLYVSDPTSAERKSLSILMLWAVFTNRSKLAKVLWRHSDQPIHIALIISMIYENLEAYVDSNLRQEIHSLSREFSEMATGILDASYKDSSCRAYDVLSEENKDWSYKTAVDIAANAKNRTFLSHPCCQKWLSTLFLGNIRVRDVTWGVVTFPQWFKVVLCAFFVFPMYIWIRFNIEPLHSWDLHVASEGDSDEDHDERDGEEEVLIDSNQGKDDFLRPRPSVVVLKNPEKGPFDFTGGLHHEQVATLLREKEVFIRSPLSIWKMIFLMWSAPITKFWTFQIFYMIYLGFFSMAVLWPSCGNKELDIIVCSWTTLILIEYIRRTYILYKKYTSVPLFYKCIEILLIIVFIILYVLGRILNVGDIFTPYTGKVILCIGLLYFFYRLIAIYLPISPTLGPLLYRVRLMVFVDFVNFMRMTLLVIISGGIVIQAVLYPDYPLSIELFRKAFHRAWFSLFLTPIGELEGEDRCNATKMHSEEYCIIGKFSDYTCPNTGLWPYLFSIQYFVFLKLILLTLLYALFSATASKLQSETDAIWKFQRYQLVVDFANRLRLPPPLSIFSYVITVFTWLYKCFLCRFCRSRDEIDKNAFFDSSKGRLSERDYNYWRQLAQEYSKQKSEEEIEKQITKKQMDIMMTITEDVDYQKKIMHQLKSRLKELDRMMTHSHVYLENIKHLTEKIQERGLQSQVSLHILSRHTPYPGTSVQRYPVPDKYVPWEVMWTEYDPVAYTKPRSDFDVLLQSFVDEDVLLLRATQDIDDERLPVFQWNCLSSNPAGISIDRTSWILGESGTNIVYKLDSECVPRNIYGRTGLRGRGALCRWGPNHFVLAIITRWQKSGGRGLEFVVMRGEKRGQISLPGGFVPGEQRYVILQSLFKQKETNAPIWKSHEDMLEFFRNCCETLQEDEEVPTEVKCEMVKRGYMDDPWNTDQAWREVELWHIHYGGNETLSQYFQQSLSWRLITEDVFIKLPSGQAVLLQDITQRLQPIIF
ncbi:transient receptor potential cation channel subfamily M member-like 2 isoform X2 [Parasteatoda tepidariorum]|uniref:transient receptor potential cation channel subfamily M member-like 2 isoform X2 n=1 Tax=Parasteatoda tepidariorum TaxID=114398 RepID=UPI001C71E059|nr:transient receptor potential cation channel subfamily M member 1 isoform X2 [Parasteatoda tepidariorum]